ncbi:hypothetical protein VTO42DRAFT_4584 [Malbranchea cinnamomea]
MTLISSHYYLATRVGLYHMIPNLVKPGGTYFRAEDRSHRSAILKQPLRVIRNGSDRNQAAYTVAVFISSREIPDAIHLLCCGFLDVRGLRLSSSPRLTEMVTPDFSKHKIEESRSLRTTTQVHSCVSLFKENNIYMLKLPCLPFFQLDNSSI